MQVKNFSENILRVAVEEINSRDVSNLTTLTGLVTMGLSTLAAFQLFGDPSYHISGFISTFSSKAAEKYVGRKMLKAIDDERFREYGVDKYVIRPEKSSSDISSKNLFNAKQLLIDAVVTAASTALPPLGHAYASISPLTYITVRDEMEAIRKSYEIGDQVKKLIDGGSNEEQINDYLFDRIADSKRRKFLKEK